MQVFCIIWMRNSTLNMCNFSRVNIGITVGLESPTLNTAPGVHQMRRKKSLRTYKSLNRFSSLMSRPVTSAVSGNKFYPQVISAKVNLAFLYFCVDEFGLFLLVK